jgi:hypothetical protein
MSSDNEVTMEIPFNLEKLFTLSYGFDELQAIMKFIFAKLGKMDQYMRKMEISANVKYREVEKYNPDHKFLG